MPKKGTTHNAKSATAATQMNSRKTTRAPVSASQTTKTYRSSSTINKDGRQIAVFKGREYFTDMVSGEAMAGSRFSDVYIEGEYLNPSNDEVFTWLSGIASRYETFNWVSVKLHFVPLVPTSTAGRVMLAFDADAHDDIPTSKTTLLCMEANVSASVWQPDVCLDIPKSELNTIRNRYNTTTAPSDVSSRLVSSGRLLFGSVGVDTGAVDGPGITIGELHIEYVVHLLIPQIHEAIGIESLDGYTASVVPVSAPITDLVYSETPAATFVPAGTNVLEFNRPGNYLMTWEAVPATLNVTALDVYAVSPSYVSGPIGGFIDASYGAVQKLFDNASTVIGSLRTASWYIKAYQEGMKLALLMTGGALNASNRFKIARSTFSTELLAQHVVNGRYCGRPVSFHGNRAALLAAAQLEVDAEEAAADVVTIAKQ